MVRGWIDMTRYGLEGFGDSLRKDDEVVIEAIGSAMGRAGKVINPARKV
jgi:hypothetical protein